MQLRSIEIFFVNINKSIALIKYLYRFQIPLLKVIKKEMFIYCKFTPNINSSLISIN